MSSFIKDYQYYLRRQYRAYIMSLKDPQAFNPKIRVVAEYQ